MTTKITITLETDRDNSRCVADTLAGVAADFMRYPLLPTAHEADLAPVHGVSCHIEVKAS